MFQKLIYLSIGIFVGFYIGDIILTNNSNQVEFTENNRSPKIFCWILTGNQNHETKAKHVKNTWLKRCDGYVFMSSQSDPELPSIDLGVREGRNFLWAKTRAAFKWIYEQKLIDEFDWFLKADDDTYVVVENLRNFLSNYSANDPIHFGCKLRLEKERSWNSGGAGYVLSRETVKRFVNSALPNPDICNPGPFGDEDLELGNCLDNLKIRNLDTRDSQNLHRFHPFNVSFHVDKSTEIDWNFWIWNISFFPIDKNPSDSAISFHYTTPEMMYWFEYFLYKFNIF
ncbi:unnamed protein product [Caenorhabditis angaria]|uniref:Glycoprotein-N-acetylgalactosamine 3-beta-galactosyltransferase 1 n=1 Tax=Caenorhabditis angaria TaxID=860376 RepID=A0A9P1IIH0_9PELO|nr:unnamed protein product [Caenorhabditis angaria]